jgi:hypothetical protein
MDIVEELILDYDREPRPEGAEVFRSNDVRIRAAEEIKALRLLVGKLPTGNCRRPDDRA